MLLKRTFVATSDIEGVGVFAAEPINAGELIWKLDTDFDRLVQPDHLKNYPAHMREFLLRYAYPYHEDPLVLVLEADNGRFMNHSDHPNTRFNDIIVGYATIDIEIGQELLCDYTEFDPDHVLTPTLANLKSGEKHGQIAG